MAIDRHLFFRFAPRFRFFGIFAPDFRAVLRDAATACFRGCPERTISRMFEEIVDRDRPRRSGIHKSSGFTSLRCVTVGGAALAVSGSGVVPGMIVVSRRNTVPVPGRDTSGCWRSGNPRRKSCGCRRSQDCLRINQPFHSLRQSFALYLKPVLSLIALHVVGPLPKEVRVTLAEIARLSRHGRLLHR